MAIEMSLLVVISVVAILGGITLSSNSVMLTGALTFMALGYIAIRSGDTFFQLFYLVATFFMVMGAAVFMVRLVMGDTA